MLLCGARELVAARLLGSAAAFAVQRAPRLKAGYNLAAYAFEAALAVLAVHLLLPATDGLRSGRSPSAHTWWSRPATS